MHILGFTKVVGDIAQGARRVIGFFAIAFVLITLLVGLYSQSWRLAFVVVLGARVAVIWQVGLIPLLGYGIDPMSILVPFLIFAIAVSHGVQMVSAARSEVFLDADSLSAARIAFRRLLVPGGTALATDVLGFITLLVIQIRVIREISIAASLGVGLILLSNLVLLPIVLSYVRYPRDYHARLERRARHMRPVFEQRRLNHHRALQQAFFESHAVKGTTQHALRSGESIWQVASVRYKIPLWLLHQYNPGLDWVNVQPGTSLAIPLLEDRGD